MEKKEVSLREGALSKALGSEWKERWLFLRSRLCRTLVGAVLGKPERETMLSAPLALVTKEGLHCSRRMGVWL